MEDQNDKITKKIPKLYIGIECYQMEVFYDTMKSILHLESCCPKVKGKERKHGNSSTKDVYEV